VIYGFVHVLCDSKADSTVMVVMLSPTYRSAFAQSRVWIFFLHRTRLEIAPEQDFHTNTNLNHDPSFFCPTPFRLSSVISSEKNMIELISDASTDGHHHA
jgi:hypothetical protein